MESGGRNDTPPERPRGIDALEQASTVPRSPLARLVQSTLTDAPAARGGGEDARSNLARGSMLDRFLILDQIGVGGMGVVLSAFDPHLDRKVAIKVLRPKAFRALASGEARERLLREARAIARISHPNVITVHEVGTVDPAAEGGGEVFVAMEHIDGGTLKDALAFRPRDWRSVLSLFVQAGRGLAAAHRKGLVHRDFKPDNVLVDRDERRVLVTDFGLVSIRDESSQVARLLPPGRALSSSDSGTLTETGAVMGTPAYMAPEQHLGHATDARSDQFSFCAALWEALYGERPFEGNTIDELAMNVLGGKLVRPPGVRIPGWLREIVSRGLSTRPQGRFESMDALLDAITKHTRRSTARRGAVVAAAAAAIAVAAGIGLLQVGGTDRTEIAQQRIAQLEAALEHKDAELGRTVAALEVERARSESAETERARRLDNERLRLIEERRVKEEELLRLEQQMMVLLPDGKPSRRPRRATVEEATLDLAPAPVSDHPSRPDSAADQPPSRAEPRLPVRPSRTDILAGLGEVRAEVVRCGKLRDYSSNRSFSEWERAELSRFSGEVPVQIKIRPDGTVGRARAQGAPQSIARCIEKRVSEALFSRSSAGRVYTHVFTFLERN